MERDINKGLDFEKYPEGLMPVLVQDIKTGRVMMTAFANKQALDKTLETGLATFWTRSRNRLWTKGEESGNTLTVKKILTDCDLDALLYIVNVDGPEGACAVEGQDSCFFNEIDLKTGQINNRVTNTMNWSRVLLEEEQMIEGRKTANPEKSATAKALLGNIARIAQKFGEEAIEVVCAFIDPEQGKDRIVKEIADLMYRLQIALVKVGISWQEVEDEIVARRK